MNNSIEFNKNEITEIIFNNIIKMLYRRNVITSTDIKINKLNIQNVYEIILADNKICKIFYSPFKITNVSNNSPIDDFLKDEDMHKIIIYKDVSKKALNQILFERKNSEFFFEHEFMNDITELKFICHHQLLSIDEKNEVISKFPESTLSRIFLVDFMSRYYGASVGDIFRIIRPSISSGYETFYRKVVLGNINILFDR